MDGRECYFLIGGSGFLGGSFYNFLKGRGINVRNISRGELSNSKSLSFNADILQKLHVSETKNIIVDFAYTSVPNTSFADPVKDFTENLYNVNSHLEFARHLPNPSYIYISSGGTVYGNVVEKDPISETAGNFPLSPYGITKLASEKYAIMHKEIYNLDIKIVRPANIYGPGQKPFRGQGFISTAIAKIIQGELIQIFGDGSTIRDYLHVDDFSDALFNIITKGSSGEIYNVGSQIGYSTNFILETINSIVGTDQKSSTVYLPIRPFDVDYNVLNCSKLKSLTPNYLKTDIHNGIMSAYIWLKNYLKINVKN